MSRTLVGENLGMKPHYSKDGVHPTPAGDDVMALLAEAAITAALRTQ